MIITIKEVLENIFKYPLILLGLLLIIVFIYGSTIFSFCLLPIAISLILYYGKGMRFLHFGSTNLILLYSVFVTKFYLDFVSFSKGKESITTINGIESLALLSICLVLFSIFCLSSKSRIEFYFRLIAVPVTIWMSLINGTIENLLLASKLYFPIIIVIELFFSNDSYKYSRFLTFMWLRRNRYDNPYIKDETE